GVLLGIATLFRHDFGVYGILSATIVCLLEQATIHHNFKDRLRNFSSAVSWLFIGIAATAGLGYGILAALDFRALWTNLIAYPLITTYYRKLPFPFDQMRLEWRSVQWTLTRWALRVDATILARILVYVSPFIAVLVALGRFVSKRSWKDGE